MYKSVLLAAITAVPDVRLRAGAQTAALSRMRKDRTLGSKAAEEQHSP